MKTDDRSRDIALWRYQAIAPLVALRGVWLFQRCRTPVPKEAGHGVQSIADTGSNRWRTACRSVATWVGCSP